MDLVAPTSNYAASQFMQIGGATWGSNYLSRGLLRFLRVNLLIWAAA